MEPLERFIAGNTSFLEEADSIYKQRQELSRQLTKLLTRTKCRVAGRRLLSVLDHYLGNF